MIQTVPVLLTMSIIFVLQFSYALCNEVHIKLENDELVSDISFLFADIKYTGKELKICDIGGMFTGGAHTRQLNGKKTGKTYWDLFWHYLSSFNKPIWYLGDQKPSAMLELEKVGGKAFSTLEEFLAYYQSQLAAETVGMSASKKNKRIVDYKGILVIKKRRLSRKSLVKNYPDILLVNVNTKRFTGKRNPLIELLEKNPHLHAFIPSWKVYKKEYSSTLAAQIIEELPADFYIIKPVRGILSRGVLMVHKEELDRYLKLILQDPQAINATSYINLAYWKTDTQENFFVQAYAPSKTITHYEKQYDPTMRVIFFLSHDQGSMGIDVAAGYWKIPPKSLDQEAPLTEKHITRPFFGRIFFKNSY